MITLSGAKMLRISYALTLVLKEYRVSQSHF